MVETPPVPGHDVKATPPVKPKILRGLLMIGAVLAGLGVIGTIPRLGRRVALAETQAAATAPRKVLVAKATVGPARVDLTLPGTVAPLRSTMLYAKTTGFV